MKTKEVIEKIEKIDGIDKKVSEIGRLFIDELVNKMEVRHMTKGCFMSSLKSLREEMAGWVRAIKRKGKYEWILDDAGYRMFDKLLEKELKRGGENR